jgi:hypothetical protein
MPVAETDRERTREAEWDCSGLIVSNYVSKVMSRRLISVSPTLA